MFRILLVEDNPMNRKLIHRRFKSESNYQIAEAHDGETAMRIAYHHQPDLILMDMSLPIKDGWETTAELRKHDQTRDIPVIALTAHAMEKDRKRSIEVGCDGFISKPINFEDLKTLMAELLANGRVDRV